MKAIVFEKYGKPDVLQLKDIEIPEPDDHEVLIKMHATSVNDWDWALMQGKPWVNRMMFGLFKPNRTILGSDVAGVVEKVGKSVTRFKPGDEVLGDICTFWGCLAEYVCAREDRLFLKPGDMTFEQAASLPQAALLALQGLCDKRKILPGQKVLINGAGGGTGTFAIQIARSLGAEVTGVDRTSKLALMHSLGASEVIDFTKEDFHRHGKQYDMILDVSAHHSIFDYKRSLKPGGIYLMVGGASNRIIQIMMLGPLISMMGNKHLGILAHKPNKGMEALLDLIKAGKVKPVIDKIYSLESVGEAFKQFGAGEAKGKIIIKI